MHDHQHMNENMSSEEIVKMLEYMYKHNSSHLTELEELAKQIKTDGKELAYEKLESAISKYSEANILLKETLKEME